MGLLPKIAAKVQLFFDMCKFFCKFSYFRFNAIGNIQRKGTLCV